jgi:hypothetical protein
MKKKKQTTKRKQIAEKNDFTIRELRQIAQLCTAIVRAADQDDRLHIWATFYAKAVKNAGIEESFKTKLQGHPDHEKYQSALREVGLNHADNDAMFREAAKIDQEFSDYLDFQKKLLDTPCDLMSIRKIPAEWCIKGRSSSPVAALNVDHDMVDEPEKLLDLIYEMEK